MSNYFTIEELCRSTTGEARGIDNTPPADVASNLNALIEYVLDPVRELWGGPIRVNSGYRCAALNRAVGGSSGSQHMRGEAADVTVGSRDGNRELFDLIQGSGIEFDQLIDEQGFSWVHVSYRAGRNRKQVLSL